MTVITTRMPEQGGHLFHVADHCNEVPMIPVHSSEASIGFTLSVCLSV